MLDRACTMVGLESFFVASRGSRGITLVGVWQFPCMDRAAPPLHVARARRL
jgi:hypothetical protein